MRKYKPVIICSVFGAFILSVVTYWVSHFDWPFLPYLFLAGCLMVWVQSETVSYKFLSKLFFGSLIFGSLLTVFIFLRMYAMSHLVYDTPIPFRELWDRDIIVLAASYFGLSFLGGLIGIVLKGAYALYQNKLNWVMIFVGSLFTTIASLAVFRIKIGGTIMSGYHGLPYSYFTYQIKDVVDGSRIGQWIFLPGSFYHYIIVNYLLYLVIFIFSYYLIKFFNKKKTKKIRTVLALFILTICLSTAFMSYLPVKMSYIEHQIARAGECQQEEDCIMIGNYSPFSCAIISNKDNADRIKKLLESYPSTGKMNCNGREKAACIQKKCQVVIDHTSNETYWEMIKQAIEDCQVSSITQNHDREVSAKLKTGRIIEATEPVIDEIFELIAEAVEDCGKPQMATE